jgi:hypothetical protein
MKSAVCSLCRCQYLQLESFGRMAVNNEFEEYGEESDYGKIKG